MDLAKIITEQVETKLSDGTIEQLVEKKVEGVVEEIINSALGRWGEPYKALEKRIAENMTETIEKHDFGDYLVKLDLVLTNIVNNIGLRDNKKILENFNQLMVVPCEKQLKISDIFKKFCEYVAQNVEIYGRKVDFSTWDEPVYEPVTCKVNVEDDDWSSYYFHCSNVTFEADLDDESQKEKFTFRFRLSREKNGKSQLWKIRNYDAITLDSLRYLDDFTLLVIKLSQAGTEIELDNSFIEEDIIPDERPRPTYQ